MAGGACGDHIAFLGAANCRTSPHHPTVSVPMFTVLACLFVLLAVDGFFRTRTLNDDTWTGENVAKKRSKGLARLMSVLWIGLAIVSLFVAWQFEW